MLLQLLYKFLKMSLILGLVLLVGFTSAKVDECVKKTSCSCENSKGVLDLSPLANRNDTPVFKDLRVIGEIYDYSWNPCLPFTEGMPTSTDASCKGVAACQVLGLFGTRVYNLGDQSSAAFHTANDSTVTLVYTHHLVNPSDTLATRSAHVKLVCDQGIVPGQTVAVGEAMTKGPGNTAIYNFIYTGKYACIKAGSGRMTLSISSFVFIVLVGLWQIII